MKKKGVNIILWAGMLVIWGFVTKKTLFFFGKDDEKVVAISPITFNDPLPELKKDTFELHVLERDPFLDVVTKRKSPRPLLQPKTPKRVSNPIPKRSSNATWPKLQYFGYLKGHSQTGKLAVLKIDNKLHRVREKRAIEEIQVLKIYKDSVLLKRNGATKVVLK
ncbi:hypothetical protein [Flagellimonas pacifica]|uniref:Uncharacterized protein n=1 Tax=Flagellimonas pacifica TaxID=1247520 RepID=A0A285MWY8_9FLAO|nr:hypothetical protein [Allomuricauda parva]SNZ01702.1 hypothetical protein SAMN06265377_3544 [Allomuricauda parva]